MKSYEKESLVKNFLVFFSLLEILLILLFFELYQNKKEIFKKEIFKTMQLCSYTFDCDRFTFDFAPKKGLNINHLYQDSDLFSYFEIPKSKKFYLKITYPKKEFDHGIDELKKGLFIKFLLSTAILFILSLFFTFYSLKPIREALKLNDEFIKDILHDFNTPITSMKINMHMFKEEYGNNQFVDKISHSIETILMLQNNLKSFLYKSPSKTTTIDVALLAKNRIDIFKNLYPNINFIYDKKDELIIDSHEELLTRVIDNLLSNAAKYNKTNGEVLVTIGKNRLTIKDSGSGINDIKRVFDRYYKEHTRGLGLGLHIVKKLTDELSIKLDIESKKDIGTTIRLNFAPNDKIENAKKVSS